VGKTFAPKGGPRTSLRKKTKKQPEEDKEVKGFKKYCTETREGQSQGVKGKETSVNSKVSGEKENF